MAKYELIGYRKCAACRTLEKIINDKGLEYTFRDIVEDRLSIDEIKDFYKKSNFPLKMFFNTSGTLYREMGLSKKLDTMDEEEKFELLASNGKLVKRPILLIDGKVLIAAQAKRYLLEFV